MVPQKVLIDLFLQIAHRYAFLSSTANPTWTKQKLHSGTWIESGDVTSGIGADQARILYHFVASSCSPFMMHHD